MSKYLKIEYDDSTSDLSPVELIVYSWIKEWCRNHQGKCTKTYTEILKMLPCRISEGSLKRAVWTLIELNLIKRSGSKSDPVLTVYGDFSETQTEQSEDDSKDQNDLLETDSKDQNDPTKRSNRSEQKINLNFSTIINRSLKDHSRSSSPDSFSNFSSSIPTDSNESETKLTTTNNKDIAKWKHLSRYLPGAN
jgi:hypothetical protein